MKRIKKIGIFVLCIGLLASLQAFSDSNCPVQEKKCPQTYEAPKICDKFLCTEKETEGLFKETGLSDSQICTARKLQEKYEQETLSVNDRLEHEEQVLSGIDCSCKSEIRLQKRKIKNLKKTRREICSCYQKQFKSMLSNPQRKAYEKYIK